MAGKRYNYVPQSLWKSTTYPPLRGVDEDLIDIEARLGAPGPGDGLHVLTDDGTWKTLSALDATELLPPASTTLEAGSEWWSWTGAPTLNTTAGTITLPTAADKVGFDQVAVTPGATLTLAVTTAAGSAGSYEASVSFFNSTGTYMSSDAKIPVSVSSASASCVVPAGAAMVTIELKGADSDAGSAVIDKMSLRSRAAGSSGGAVAPSNMQTSLGLTSGSGSTTTVTSSALTGVTGTWSDATDTVPYSIGTRWTAGADGTVTHIRVQLTTRQYDGKTITVALYSDAGTSLGTGSKVISASDALGWVDIPLSAGVSVTKDSVYRAVSLAPLANDGSAHFAKKDWGWDTYTSTGDVVASKTGGNGWTQWNTSTITFPTTAENTYFNMYGVDVILAVQQTSTTGGVRMPVVAYYDDTTAATMARPTNDPLVTVLWFGSGTAMPANSLAGVDKVWTA